MRWQSILKTIHIWLGLICGAVLSLTCLSGSIAVFRPQIEAALSPRLAPSPEHADLDDAVARVLAQNEGVRLTRVLLPAPDRNTYVLTLESGQPKPRRIVIDAATGQIAGELHAAWLDWIIDFHHNLLASHTGRRVVGVVGIILFVMSLTGLVLWLLRGPSWRSLIRVSATGPRRRFYFELHRAMGLWAYAFLTVLSFTGIALAFPEPFRAVLGPRAAAPTPKPAASKSFRPLGDYIAISHAALPLAQLTELRLPKSPKGSISVRFRVPGDLGDTGRDELSVAASGRVLGVHRISDESAGVRLQSAFSPIHYGEVGGIGVRVLWCLAGVAPSVLFVSGFLFWLRKKPRRDSQKPSARDEFLVTQQSL